MTSSTSKGKSDMTSGTSKGKSDRLLRQPDEPVAYTAALLDRAGLRPGPSAIRWA
jgi:hypothetical protein